MACANGWSAVDTVDNFFLSKEKKIISSKIFNVGGKLKDARVVGNNVMYTNPWTSRVHFLENNAEIVVPFQPKKGIMTKHLLVLFFKNNTV